MSEEGASTKIDVTQTVGTETGQGQVYDRRLVDGKWLCLNNNVFMEYVDNEWKKIDEDKIDDLKQKWESAGTVVVPVEQLTRLVDGRYVYPKENTFLEFVDNEWKEILLEQVDDVRAKYEAADPFKKNVDGVELKWDPIVQQWVPEKVTEDFIAIYQRNYGVSYDYSKLPESEKEKKLKERAEKQAAKEERKRKAEEDRNREPCWTEISDDRNTNVYVSNLPTDITEEDYIEFMSKAGIIMKDPRTHKMKYKLYRTPDGELKGDGTCCYVKMESVQIALDVLDGWELRGRKIHVEKAQFQMKGNFDPLKKKRKLTVQQKKRFIENQNKAFEWEPEKPRNYRPASHCTVILKNVFTLEEMLENIGLALDLKNQVKEVCDRFGQIKKVITYENHPEGVVSITFSTVEEADYCISLMNGGILRKREITAENWDGKTKYKVAESFEESKKRDKEWENFLKSSDDEKTDEEIGNDEKTNEEVGSDGKTNEEIGKDEKIDEEIGNNNE